MNYKLFINYLLTITILLCALTNVRAQETDAPNAATASFSTFSAPQNLGAIVNSDVNDLLPTPAPNGLCKAPTGNSRRSNSAQPTTFPLLLPILNKCGKLNYAQASII